MKKIFSMMILIMAVGFICSHAWAQATVIEWQQSIGGSSDDYLLSVQQTSDDGYILGGTSYSGISGDKTEASRGGLDYWVVKLNSSGDIEWQHTIGGSDDDGLQSIQQTLDGGYILGGVSYSGNSGDKTETSLGGYDYWVIKLNSTGGIEWQNTIGGSNEDYLYAVQQSTDGGYVLGGTSYSGVSGDKTEANISAYYPDYWVLKLSSTGDIEWQNTIGGSDHDWLYSIHQTSDYGYILGGSSSSGISGDKAEASSGSGDYWVVKLNAVGNIEWQNTIGGNDIDEFYSIQQASDEGYILGGSSSSGISGDKTEASLGYTDYWVVKLNAIGNIEWQNTIGGNDYDWLYTIQQTSDNGYVLGGGSGSTISGDKTGASLGGNDYWVVKLNTIGSIEWQCTIGGSDNDVLYAIQQASDGGYILGGSSESAISGDKTEASAGGVDFWVLKLQATTAIEELAIANSVSAYPNPAGEFIIFDLSNVAATQADLFIYNSSGVLLKQFPVSHSTQLKISVDDIGSDGMYFYTVRTSDQQFFAGKFIIQR